MVVVTGQSKAAVAFTCVTSTSAGSKRLGQRHRLGLVERSKPDVTRAFTRDLLHTTSSRHTSCTAVNLPHLSLRPLPTVLPLALAQSPQGAAAMAKLTSFAVSLPLTTILVVLLASCLQAQAQTCYYPNGDPSPDDLPCSTKGGACCPVNWECFSNGLCFLPAEHYYERHSCTDQSWNDPNCPNVCTYGKQLESVLDSSRQY
jgi:hypothetical protein